MRVLLVNAVCGITSVGRITTDLAQEYRNLGHEVKIAYGREPLRNADPKDTIPIGSPRDTRLHGCLSRLMDMQGLGSRRATAAFLKKAEAFHPDLLWLQNIHGYYLNYEMLFSWIKAHPEMEVRWTLHDCWSFTGHCVYFSSIGCEKWKTGCHNCPQKRCYPASLMADRSREQYLRKKAAFCGVPRMTIIVPSQWLKRLVEQSFLKDYPVQVIPNKINEKQFCTTPGTFRSRYGLEGKKIILGVGTEWTPRKGLPDYIALSRMLSKDYQIVLVGMTPKQIQALPDTVLGIPRTDSPKELAAIYTAADVLVSASKEEVFGMTILEAFACGTPSVVYEGTACEEVAKSCGGRAVPMDLEKMKAAIIETASRSNKDGGNK